MNIEECVSETLASSGELDGLWDSIIVPTNVKDELLYHAALSLAVRPRLPFTVTALHGLILLYGPPGTGKTTLARGLAQQLAAINGSDVRLLDVHPHGLMSADHGRSQQQVQQLMDEVIPRRAEDKMLTVVVLDEVESMAVARSEAALTANPVDVHRATDAVLTALDSNTRRYPHIITVATSNFTKGLDAAFVSRSDRAISVGLPTPDALQAILVDTLKGYAEAFPELKTLAASGNLISVAQEMVGMDGRAARKLVAAAAAGGMQSAMNPGVLTIADLRSATKSWNEQQGLVDDGTP
jgi:AAA+ superfamily predicted ATPase